jgi:nitrogen regulatory protein P-II 1
VPASPSRAKHEHSAGTVIAIFVIKEMTMKKIEATIRPTKVGRVCVALERMGHPRPGISQIEDRSQKGTGYLLRGATYKADFAAKSRVEVIVEDGEIGTIIKAIRDAAFTGGTGDGEIFIYDMEDAIRIKSGGRDAAA